MGWSTGGWVAIPSTASGLAPAKFGGIVYIILIYIGSTDYACMHGRGNKRCILTRLSCNFNFMIMPLNCPMQTHFFPHVISSQFGITEYIGQFGQSSFRSHIYTWYNSNFQQLLAKKDLSSGISIIILLMTEISHFI